MTDLTPFQEKCGAELKRALQDAGREIRNWEIVHGKHETYIQADIGVVRVWVYADGACWQGFGRDRVFETPDYCSLDELQRAFCDEVVTALNQGGTGDGQ